LPYYTAGRRGGGKTTTLIMLILAVTGLWPAAAAWSPSEEERRKALMSYFLQGVAYILWDNIARVRTSKNLAPPPTTPIASAASPRRSAPRQRASIFSLETIFGRRVT